jgi:hypothetical protein
MSNIKVIYDEIKNLNESIPCNWEGECDSFDGEKLEFSFNYYPRPLTVWVDLLVMGTGYSISHYVSSDTGQNESELISNSGLYEDGDDFLTPVTTLISDIDDMIRNNNFDSLDEMFEGQGYEFT